MAKKTPQSKKAPGSSASAKQSKHERTPRKSPPLRRADEKPKPTKLSLKDRLAEAKKLEAQDAAPPASAPRASKLKLGSGDHPERNSDFPNTFIREIAVSLDDPDHWVTLSWSGSKAASQQTGPFRSSPGAGVQGVNCDNASTSLRTGTKCTPKGTRLVEGFQRRLNSSPSATYVTWFMQRRGIALHYYPSVPKYAASHGCVRLESERVARLIQDNSKIGVTKVTVSGTWTKPAKQW